VRENSHGQEYNFCLECCKHVHPVSTDQGEVCPFCERILQELPAKANLSNDKLAASFSTTEHAQGQAGKLLPPINPGCDSNAAPEPPRGRPPRGIRSDDRVKELVEKARLEIDAAWENNPLNRKM
jgi:hypothetical protein